MSHELAKAHARIAALEALLAKPPPSRRSVNVAAWALILTVSGLVGALVPLSSHIESGPAHSPPDGELVLRGNPEPVLMTWRGVDLALVPAWHRGDPQPLHFVGLDRRTLAVRWVSPGFAVTATDRVHILPSASGVLVDLASLPHSLSLDDGWRPGPTLAAEKRPAAAGSFSFTAEPRLRGPDYEVVVPGIGYGSHIGNLVVDGDQLLFTANDSLFVVEAASGKLRQRLDEF